MELDIYDPRFEPAGCFLNFPLRGNDGIVWFIEALSSPASGVMRPRNSAAATSVENWFPSDSQTADSSQGADLGWR